jgi:hypothetical protein
MVRGRCCGARCPSRAAPQVNRIASEGLDWAGMSDVPFVTMITGVATRMLLLPRTPRAPSRLRRRLRALLRPSVDPKQAAARHLRQQHVAGAGARPAVSFAQHLGHQRHAHRPQVLRRVHHALGQEEGVAAAGACAGCRLLAAVNGLQGLDPALKTVLVFYGGLGTPRMLKIAEGDTARQ